MAARSKNVSISNARICFRNFSGKEGRFNPAGNRNFCVILDDELAKMMLEDGWNVKYLRPREDGDEPQPYVQISVSYRNIPPKVVLVTSHGKSILDEDSVGTL